MAHSTINAASAARANVRDAAEKFRETVTPQAREMIDEVSDLTQDLFRRASGLFQSDRAKTTGLIVGAVAIGLVGFFVGRSSVEQSSPINPSRESY